MKKILLSFFLALSLFGCSGDAVHRASDNVASKDLSKVMFFNMIESVFGCKYAIIAADAATFFSPSNTKAVYECQGENNTFVGLSTIRDAEDHTVEVIIGVPIALLALLSIIFVIQSYSSPAKILTLNTGNRILEVSLNLFFRFKTVLIFVIALGIGWMLATGFLDEVDKEKLLKEKSVEIPNFSVKAAFAKSIYDYQLCVKSSTIVTDEDPSIIILKTDSNYILEGHYNQCELTGGFVIDKQGIEIAKANGFFDYESMQENSIISNLRTLFKKTDTIAKRTAISKSINMIVNLPENLSCDNIPKSYDGLTKEDRAEAVWKEIECASRDFVVSMTKFKGMTEERMDTLAELNGTRRVHICEGEFGDTPYLNRQQMVEKYRSCIATNCAESNYACSIALSKFNEANKEKQIDFLLTSTFSVFEDEPEIRSAKMFLGTLTANLQFDETPPPFGFDKNHIAKLPATTMKDSTMSFKEVQELLLNMKILEYEKAALEFSPSDFINRQLDPDNGGLYGMQRFIDCSKSYFTITPNHYDCGSFIYESKLVGYTMYSGALQLISMNKLMKPKEGYKKLDKTDPSYTAATEAMKMAGVNKKILALALPFLVDNVGALVFEDVFQQNYHKIMGQKGEYYAALSCVMLSPSCSKAIDNIAGALLIGYAVFAWVIPLSPLFIIIGILNSYYGRPIYRSIINIIYYIVKFGSEQVRRDIDKHDLVTYTENLAIKPFAIAAYFVFSQLLFYIIMLFIVQDIETFVSALFGIKADSDGFVGQIVVKVFSVVFIYFFYVLSLLVWIKGVNSLDSREGTVTSSDGRIQNAAEFRSYAKAMKGKGMD